MKLIPQGLAAACADSLWCRRPLLVWLCPSRCIPCLPVAFLCRRPCWRLGSRCVINDGAPLLCTRPPCRAVHCSVLLLMELDPTKLPRPVHRRSLCNTPQPTESGCRAVGCTTAGGLALLVFGGCEVVYVRVPARLSDKARARRRALPSPYAYCNLASLPSRPSTPTCLPAWSFTCPPNSLARILVAS